MFESMFSLSSEADTPATPEGDADENPIRLPDRADEIRALLWALYALPDELSAALSPHANCMQLYDLGNIAHKYQFRQVRSRRVPWCLDADKTPWSGGSSRGHLVHFRSTTPDRVSSTL
jgi:hypothetical protein